MQDLRFTSKTVKTAAKKAKGSKAPPIETTTEWWSFSFVRECGHVETSGFRFKGDLTDDDAQAAAREAAAWLADQLCRQCHGIRTGNLSLVAEWAAFWGCSDVDAEARLDRAIATGTQASLWPPKVETGMQKADKQKKGKKE